MPSPFPTTRLVAVQILAAVLQGRQLSALLAEGRERRGVQGPLLTKLVKGVLTARPALEALVGDAIGSDQERISPEGMALLFVSLYQLRWFEEVDRARVVAETEILATRLALSRKLLQKVLEASPQQRHRLTSGERSPVAVARRYNHPEWLVAEWFQRLGPEETESLCRVNNTPWPVTLRTNLLRTTTSALRRSLARDKIKFRPGNFLPDATVVETLPRGRSLNELRVLTSGHAFVQDEASQLVSLLLEPRPKQRVIDLCAAPGGKTVHCATLMRNQGEILAIDSDARRLALVRENAHRANVKIITTRQGDGTAWREPEQWDRVLIDAPCSGFGVLGRKTDIRDRMDEEKREKLIGIQKRLLARGATLLAPGGRLVYSTCTLTGDENEAIVGSFLSAHPDFRVAPLASGVPEELRGEDGGIVTWPHRHGIAGGYAVALERRL